MKFIYDANQISEEFDLSLSRLSRLKRDGKLKGCYKKIGGKFHYDKDLLREALAQNRSPRHRIASDKVKAQKQSMTAEEQQEIQQQKQVIKQAGLKMLSLADAQELKANYDAALKKLEYEQKNGDLLEKASVEKEAFETARRVRDSILNIPDRIGAELASSTDIFIVKEKLTKSLIQALEELSK